MARGQAAEGPLRRFLAAARLLVVDFPQVAGAHVVQPPRRGRETRAAAVVHHKGRRHRAQDGERERRVKWVVGGKADRPAVAARR